ncbi:PILR alpha-associated neural protein [Gastrophryne carolinensis]
MPSLDVFDPLLYPASIGSLSTFDPVTEVEVPRLLNSSHPTTCTPDTIALHLIQSFSPTITVTELAMEVPGVDFLIGQTVEKRSGLLCNNYKDEEFGVSSPQLGRDGLTQVILAHLCVSKRSGFTSAYFIFYFLLLSSTYQAFANLLHPTRFPYHGAIRPASSSLQAAHQRLHASLHSTRQPSGKVHISSYQQASSLILNVSPKTTYLPLRNAKKPYQQFLSARGKRQSPASSLLFPAALEEAVPPSPYPWAILWDPTVSDEEGSQSSASFTPRPYYHPEWGLLEHDEPARGLDLKGIPTTMRPHGFPPQEGTDPQLYVTIVISVLIVLVATGIIIKFCCERRQKRRRNRNDRCALPEEGSLQPLTDLSPDADIPGLQPLKLGDFSKSALDDRSIPCRTSK